MKYRIIRKAILQEDEGREHFQGDVDADTEQGALIEAERRFGGGYFRASDFRALDLVAAIVEYGKRMRATLVVENYALSQQREIMKHLNWLEDFTTPVERR